MDDDGWTEVDELETGEHEVINASELKKREIGLKQQFESVHKILTEYNAHFFFEPEYQISIERFYSLILFQVLPDRGAQMLNEGDKEGNLRFFFREVLYFSKGQIDRYNQIFKKEIQKVSNNIKSKDRDEIVDGFGFEIYANAIDIYVDLIGIYELSRSKNVKNFKDYADVLNIITTKINTALAIRENKAVLQQDMFTNKYSLIDFLTGLNLEIHWGIQNTIASELFVKNLE